MQCEDAKQVDIPYKPVSGLDAFNDLISVQTEMAIALSDSTSNDDVCQIASSYIPQIVNANRCHFHHVENSFSGTRERAFTSHISSEFSASLKKSLTEHILEKKDVFILNDLSSYTHEDIIQCENNGITGLMVTPICLHDNVVGIITVERTTGVAFGELEKNLMRQIAIIIGLRVEYNLLLKSKEEQQTSSRQTDTVNALLKQMYVELGEAETLHRIYSTTATWITKIFGGSHISISKMDLKKNRIIFLHQHTQKQENPFDSETPLDTSSYTELIIFRKATSAYNLKKSQFVDHQRLHQELGANSALSAPLIVAGKMFGAVHICSSKPFAYGKDEEYLLSQIVSHVAILIDNRKHTESLADHAKEVDRINNKLNVTIHNMHERETELIHLLEANKELMSITSHDLKNPIGGILGLCDMIIEDLPDLEGATFQEVSENTHLIKQEAEHMMQIIKDVLDKHRKEVKHEFTMKETNVVNLIKEVILSNQSQATAKHIHIHFTHASQVLFHVDAPSFQRAIDNYLSNAIKYSPPHSNVWIELDGHSLDGSYWKVSVRDEGPGLSEDDKLKVFRKMQRLSAKPTAGEHSTGLGLYIVKQIVEQHGGTVGVDSEFGKGATFWMLISQHHKFLDKLQIESAIHS